MEHSPSPSSPAVRRSPRRAVAAGWRSVRAHPVVTAMYAFAVVGWALVNLLAGMPVPIVVVLPILVVLVAVGIRRLTRRRAGEERSSSPLRASARSVLHVAAATAVVLLAIQAIPYGRDHANPPVLGEPAWATPETRELMVRACYACHSNEVQRPFYAKIAPVSWAVQHHIDEGRSEVNYSEFTRDRRDADETIEVILDGSMPPAYFTRFGRNHEAKLTDDELATLLAGLRATPGMSDD